MSNNDCYLNRLAIVGAAVIVTVYLGAGCGAGTGPVDAGGDATVTVTLQANFGEGAAAKSIGFVAKELCPATPPAADSSVYQGEQDCDGDGGIIRYWTPSTYKVAFKRLAFENDDGDLVDIIADTGTLAAAVVVDLTTPYTLPVLDLPIGDYEQYYAEIYYHELTMPLYDLNSPQTLRVYVSDDDFPAEGNLGHHQGDITLLDAAGNESGFVPAGNLWQPGFLETVRGTINGAGGTDLQTGHLRGLFGDGNLWDSPEAMQGPDEDIFVMWGDLELELEAVGSTVTFEFDVQDAWFFEDFDNDQLFNPCDNGNQDGCGGEWSPVFNEPEVDVE